MPAYLGTCVGTIHLQVLILDYPLPALLNRSFHFPRFFHELRLLFPLYFCNGDVLQSHCINILLARSFLRWRPLLYFRSTLSLFSVPSPTEPPHPSSTTTRTSTKTSVHLFPSKAEHRTPNRGLRATLLQPQIVPSLFCPPPDQKSSFYKSFAGCTK